jgi:hypothetical protein
MTGLRRLCRTPKSIFGADLALSSRSLVHGGSLPPDALAIRQTVDYERSRLSKRMRDARGSGHDQIMNLQKGSCNK